MHTIWIFGFAIYLICAVFIYPHQAQAAPFSCTAGFYQIQANQLRVLNPSDGTYTTIGSPYGYSLNAIGYNKLDNYIYGIINLPTEAHLFRVDNSGIYTDFGAVTGLPAPDTFGYNSGDFDDSGNLYVKQLDQTLYKIDVTTNIATAIPLSSGFFVSDLVYINGYLYGVGVGPSSGSLYRIDISNGNVTSLPISLPTSGYGSGWATDADTLYFFDNSSGIIYKVTNFTTSPIVIPVLSSTPSSVNDGASCFTAPSPIPDLVATNKSASAQQGQQLIVPATSGVMVGNTGQDITLTSYTQPTHGTVVVNPDGSYTYIPNNEFFANDNFTYTISDSLGNSTSATVTITIAQYTTVSPTAGTLASTGSNTNTPIIFSVILFSSGLATLYGLYLLKNSQYQ
ncbi:cadherin-like domain-containing protein [Candidatus Saccharibacteria bacterium]|nr:cadherin-like domain-containing protein [Candidatus Saccharibacteria bacterium]